MAKMTTAPGFLTLLRKDIQGNTLAMMAAILIPLAAFSGSAIDMARLYVVKVRLQQACDAGALAGRKFMTDTNPNTTLDTTASTQAQAFFKNNFTQGWFQTSSVSFTPTKTTDSQVAGAATATVPMTIMGMFGIRPNVVNVTCEARYDVADADIMFVLDTTGSMACTTSDDTGNGCGASATSYTRPDGTTGYKDVEESGSKISGLRAAVLSFYDTLTKNTASTTTHIRYGFVPYTSTVNVGYSLPASSLVSTTWNYQTRKADGKEYSVTTSSQVSASNSSNCSSKIHSRIPTSGYDSTGHATAVTSASYRNGRCTISTTTYSREYLYAQMPVDISQYILGNSVTDPSKSDGSKSKWQGCIEERDTTASSSFDATSLPPDLDPDLSSTSNSTRWRPMWPDLIYDRGGTAQQTGGEATSDNGYPNVGDASHQQNGYVSCGKPAQRLKTMSRDDVSAYVNASDFVPLGGTYHDTGMIWGTRMISPTGPFKDDTKAWDGHQPPNRYIVFMTDGQMAPNGSIYGMYGIESIDQRVTGSYTSTKDLNYHNARFVAECQAAKNRNITVFVVGFGQTLNDQLKACASPGQAYYASDNASLTTAFTQIANQVAQLRLSK